MKSKVLFVDDEPNVLSALARMLRSLHDEWAVATADGGEQALALLAREPFDLIISDMRMPGMSGAQLLEEVGRRHPRTVRFILTGQCDEESGLRALCVAHQMLCKPCDAATLKAAVSNIRSLKALLAEETLQVAVTKQMSIPTMPNSYRRLLVELTSVAPSLDQIAALSNKDIGMAANILRLVNSSFFGLRREITNPKQAVTLLGMDTMRALIETNIISCSRAAGACQALESLQSHSHATAALAGALLRSEGADPRDIEYAIMAGLLHDVGKLVLLEHCPDTYPAMLDRSRVACQPLWEIETEVLGASHAQVGACLLGLWGLPSVIVDAVAWHHQPSQYAGPSLAVLTAVHAANALIHDDAPGIDTAFLERVNLVDRVPVWTQLTSTHRAERKLACT